jgi:hypothetical protein
MPDKTKVHTVYKLADGKRVPSVTTVLGILNKPALLDWAHQCGLNGLDYKAVRDRAGDVGTLAHYMILCYLRQEAPDYSEYSNQAIEQALTCFAKFLEWERHHEIKPILIETPLVSEQYRFGGTIDFYGEIDGQPTLLDFKTSKAIYPDMFYQLAAYAHLLHENNHLAGAAKILRIGKSEDEGFEERSAGKLDKQWEIFLACQKIYELQKEIRKGGKDDLSEA